MCQCLRCQSVSKNGHDSFKEVVVIAKNETKKETIKQL